MQMPPENRDAVVGRKREQVRRSAPSLDVIRDVVLCCFSFVGRSFCSRRRRRRRRRHAHTTLSFSFSLKQDPRRWFPSSRLRAAKRPPPRPPPADVKKAKADDEFLVVYTVRDV